MNKKLTVLSVLVLAIAMTAYSVAGTYAKYTTTQNGGSDSARVAKWKINELTAVDLFSASYIVGGEKGTTEGQTIVVADNVARGGKVNISGGQIMASGNATKIGKVGDSRVVVPCSGIVYDKNSNYPGMDTLEIKVTGGFISGAKSSIEVLTDEETPNIKVLGGTLVPKYSA